MIKFIYFDFGAILVNYDNVFTRVSKEFGLDRNEFQKFYESFIYPMDIGEMTVGEFWNECIEHFKLKNADGYNLAKSWVSDYKIIKPIHDLIYSSNGKIGMGVISNIPAEVWWAAMDENWVPNIKYNEIILSSDVKVTKPEKKIYEMAQSRLENIDPSEILFIDDKPENLVEPKLMGWKTFCFDQTQSESEVLKISKLLINKSD